MPQHDGLEWVETTFALEPRWTEEPHISTITLLAQKHLGLDDSASLSVSFFAQGAFNKLYKISLSSQKESDGQAYLMRVSLPVDPRYKTESEVATIEFVREETDIPVPRIVAWDADAGNELGFEWMLMEMCPGATLRTRWRTMRWKAKEELIRQLASQQAQLFEKRFRGIGNIFTSDTSNAQDDFVNLRTTFTLGRIVSLIFFWGDNLTHDVPRGPFTTCHEWLRTRLHFVLKDQERILSNTNDEDEIEDAELSKEVIEGVLRLLPTVFPPRSVEAEPSILFHDDLSMQNILVDEEGRLTAIVDWECVSALPLWRACQLPHLLEGRIRDQRPSRDAYAPESEKEDDQAADLDSLDNEDVNSLYWEHLMDYERGLLRKVLLDEMQILQPEWIRVMKESTFEADVEIAVHNADNAWVNKRIKRWLEALAAGTVTSLEEQLSA